MDASAEHVTWFQYRPGSVVESLRTAHCTTQDSTDDEIQSWCQLKFHPADIERAASPGDPPGPGKAPACAPCSACMLRLTGAVDSAAEPPVPVVEGAGDNPSDDSKLAVILRKAQWLLDDAAYYLPQGRCSHQEREILAATLDQLAHLIRERPPSRPTAIDQTPT
jgi:hypothetical protein